MTDKEIASAPRELWRASCLSQLALAIALLATCGSVYLSVGLGLKACPLCFYQRSFAMSVFAVLLIGMFADRHRPALCSVLAFPLAVAGLGVAAFHQYLVWTDVLECPPGLLGQGTAPAQSLTIFVLLTVVLALAVIGGPRDRQQLLSTMGAGVLGLALAWGSIISAPSLPPPPGNPYDPVKQPLDTCRPPYRTATDAGVGDR